MADFARRPSRLRSARSATGPAASAETLARPPSLVRSDGRASLVRALSSSLLGGRDRAEG